VKFTNISKWRVTRYINAFLSHLEWTKHYQSEHQPNLTKREYFIYWCLKHPKANKNYSFNANPQLTQCRGLNKCIDKDFVNDNLMSTNDNIKVI